MLKNLVEHMGDLTTLISETTVLWEESQFTHKEWFTISQMVEVLRSFKSYEEMLSSDMASLALIIPMIQTVCKALSSFLEPAVGHANGVPAIQKPVKRLQDGIEANLQPFTQ